MNEMPIMSMIFRPQTARQVVLGQTESFAVMINALTGLFIVAAVFLPWLSLFTGTLVVLLTILFGPFAGFVVSSLYSRFEFTVGKRLGGKASLDELYRLFAWSFLQMGSAVLLYSLILIKLDKPSVTTELVASIPSLVIFLCAIRNYCSNVTVCQQFSRSRGATSIIVTLLLFIVMVVCGCIGLSLLFEFGMDDGLKSFLVQP